MARAVVTYGDGTQETFLGATLGDALLRGELECRQRRLARDAWGMAVVTLTRRSGGALAERFLTEVPAPPLAVRVELLP